MSGVDYEGVETANRSRGLASKHRPVPAGVGVFVAIDGGGGGGGGVLGVRWSRCALTPRLRHILRPVVPQLQLRRMRAQPLPCRSLQLRRWLAAPSRGASSATVTLQLLLPRPETRTMTRHARLKQAPRQTGRGCS